MMFLLVMFIIVGNNEIDYVLSEIEVFILIVEWEVYY